MRGEVYALRRDAMRAGTSRYPLHRPTTTYYLCCKDMQFFSRVMPCLPTEMIAEPSKKRIFDVGRCPKPMK